MNYAPIPEISCNCSTCGWQFAGTFQQAMSLYQCQSCGAPTLFLMSPVAPHLGIWSAAGEPLDALRQRIDIAAQQQNQPAPQFTAPPTTSKPSQSPGQAPRLPNATARPFVAGQSEIVKDSADKLAPRKRRPIPVPQKNKSTTFYVSLGLSIATAAGILIATILVTNSIRPESNKIVVQELPKENAPVEPIVKAKTIPPTNARAIKLFVSDMAKLKKQLGRSVSKLSSFEDKLTIAVDAELAKISEEAESIDKAIGVDKSALASANTNLTKTQEAFRTIDKEIEFLRLEQDPLLAFIGTYKKLLVGYTDLGEMVLNLEGKRAEEHEAIKALNAAVNDAIDCEVGVDIAETPSERAAARLALADAEQRREQREADYLAARDNIAESDKAVSRKESDISSHESKVEDLYEKLDREDAKTLTLIDAIDEYKKVLIEIGRGKSEIKRNVSELDKVYRSTDSPYATLTKRKAEYRKARKSYLEARKKRSVLEKNYIDNGGGAAAKARIRTAKTHENAAKKVEKAAKVELHNADNLAKSSDAFERKLVEKYNDSLESLEESIKEAAVSLEALLGAIKTAKLRAGPNEKVRIRAIEHLENKLTKAAKARDTSVNTINKLDRKISKQRISRNALSTELTTIEKTRDWLKDSQAGKKLHAILKQLEAMNDASTIDYRDGETIESSAIGLAALIGRASMKSATSAAFRLKYSKDVEGWLGAMDEIHSTAYKIQNAGRTLVRKLAG